LDKSFKTFGSKEGIVKIAPHLVLKRKQDFTQR